MKRLFILYAILMIMVLGVAAQPHSVMTFAGPSRFGVEMMDAWQDNESDTILFKMNSMTDADITIPALTYKALGFTIPSFTIHGATFAFDMSTHNAVFAEQTFSETLEADGETKSVTGTSLTAEYDGSQHKFTLNLVMSYGRMPMPVTFSIVADYVSPSTSILQPQLPTTHQSSAIYNVGGNRVGSASAHGIYIVNGKKVLVK